MAQAFPSLLPVILLAGLGAACDIQVGDKGVSLGIARGRATDEWVRTYTLPPGGRLEVVNTNGEIQVEPSSGREVEVRVQRTARAGSDEEAQALLQSITMDEEVTPGLVRVETQTDGGERPRALMSGNRVALSYHVLVPAGLTMSFETDNGEIRLTDLTGVTRAATTNGGITGERLTGGVTASVVNGGVRLNMASVTDDIEVSTTNGGVRLELPNDVRAFLDAQCVNGGIDVATELQIEPTERSRRRVTGSVNGGGPRISASTVNGGIRITSRPSPGG